MMQAKIKCPCCGHGITVNIAKATVDEPLAFNFENMRRASADPHSIYWLDPKEADAIWPAFDAVFDSMDSLFERVFNPKLWKRKGK